MSGDPITFCIPTIGDAAAIDIFASNIGEFLTTAVGDIISSGNGAGSNKLPGKVFILG
jgi:hypothetical protein